MNPPEPNDLPADVPTPRPAPAAAAPKRINLALQGGGSHGAFTWGVLDALLEDGRVEFEGISGASAGAVNAVALAHGLAVAQQQDGDAHQLARDTLRTVWKGVMAAGSLSAMKENLSSMLPFMSLLPSPGRMMANAMQQWSSPYNLNPLNINPLRNLLKREIDFEAIGRLRRQRIFISATHVNSGKAELFTGKEVSLQAVMASTCLPQVFQAVEIGGKAYWDGGFVANPPLTPLITHCCAADILLVQINPLVRPTLPTAQADIADRVNEITFNANLLSQMQMIGFVNWLIDEGRLQEPAFKRVLMHRIDGGAMLAELGAASKLSTDAGMIEQLFDHGRAQAQQWLKKHFNAVGERSTVNIRKDYADDMVVHD